jgi:uncharacterized protein YxjI
MLKTFSNMDPARNEVALITKKMFSFLPTFFVEVNGQEAMTIKKQISFLKARYSINAAGMEVQGDWWDMDFEVDQTEKSLEPSVRNGSPGAKAISCKL